MPLAGALCLTLHAVTGFTNRSLRALVAGLLGTPYSASQMTDDLPRLRLHGLVHRLDGQHRNVLTDDGRRFYSKLGDRVPPALSAADQPNAPPNLQRALKTIDGCAANYLHHTRLKTAA
jgi:hypothetical protein